MQPLQIRLRLSCITYIKHSMLRDAQVTNPASTHATEITPAAERRTMIDSQLRTVGVTNEAILLAMNNVPRENFVPAALRGLAYADAALEVAPGRWLLEPLVLALLLQNAHLKPGERVLVVGAATGYSAAVVAHIGAHATALESDPALAVMAHAAGIETVCGPLNQGWAASAPYDLILFEGAIETIPPAFAAQLAPSGRVAAVVRQAGVGRACAGLLVGGTRIGGLPFLEVAAKPLPGFAAAREFVF
jgi:protein-L-isoaspartate(D-aspartate) O-methyltransferase